MRRLCPQELTVQSNNAEDEDQRQNQNNHRINLQTRGLVGVQSQHGAAGTASASGPRARRPSIGNLFLLIGGSASADGGTGATWGRRRPRAADTGAASRRRSVVRRRGSGRRHCDEMTKLRRRITAGFLPRNESRMGSLKE
jgi:hypothetical protein